MGLECCTASASGTTRAQDQVRLRYPSALGQHVARQERTTSPPTGRRVVTERERTSPPEVITVERRRTWRRARPARAHVERRVDRGEGPGDPSGAHGTRRAKRRGAGRAPGETPAAAPRACGAERRRPPARWSRRGNGGTEPGPRGPRGGAARHGPRAGRSPAAAPRARGAERRRAVGGRSGEFKR